MASVNTPYIVIVVPVGPLHPLVKRCLSSCAALRYPHRAVALVTDVPVDVSEFGAINIVTGSPTMTGPAVKRDAAMRAFPNADIYAFLDDDAYVDPEWLDELAAVFAENPEVAAVGGPGLMPDDQTPLEALSAAVMETKLGSGGVRYRFWPDAARDCADFPAYNLAVRGVWLHRVGGWGNTLYGGEDTYLCAKLADAGGVIRYDPRVYVYHYRRRIWPKHAWQVFNVGRSRACFARAGERLSLRPLYFAPSIGLIGLAVLLVAVGLIPALRPSLALLAFLVWGSISVGGHPGRLPLRTRLLLPLGLLIHHGAYGYGFLLGLWTGRRNGLPRGFALNNRS